MRCLEKGGYISDNYKGFHFIILLTYADATYKFLLADMGTNCSDHSEYDFIRDDIDIPCIIYWRLGICPKNVADEGFQND